MANRDTQPANQGQALASQPIREKHGSSQPNREILPSLPIRERYVQVSQSGRGPDHQQPMKDRNRPTSQSDTAPAKPACLTGAKPRKQLERGTVQPGNPQEAEASQQVRARHSHPVYQREAWPSPPIPESHSPASQGERSRAKPGNEREDATSHCLTDIFHPAQQIGAWARQPISEGQASPRQPMRERYDSSTQ